MQTNDAIVFISQKLDAINQCLQQNPDYFKTITPPPSPLHPMPLITMHKSTSSGGKFWTGAVIDGCLHLRWGRINTRGNRKVLSAQDCFANNSMQELKRRSIEKLQKGYSLHQTCFPK